MQVRIVVRGHHIGCRDLRLPGGRVRVMVGRRVRGRHVGVLAGGRHGVLAGGQDHLGHHGLLGHDVGHRGVEDVGRPARSQQRVERLVAVPREGGHAADQQRHGVAAERGGQHAGQQAVVVRHHGHLAPRVAERGHHVTQRQQPEVGAAAAGHRHAVAGRQVQELQLGLLEHGEPRAADRLLGQLDGEQRVGAGLRDVGDVAALVVQRAAHLEAGEHLGGVHAAHARHAGHHGGARAVLVQVDRGEGLGQQVPDLLVVDLHELHLHGGRGHAPGLGLHRGEERPHGARHQPEALLLHHGSEAGPGPHQGVGLAGAGRAVRRHRHVVSVQ